VPKGGSRLRGMDAVLDFLKHKWDSLVIIYMLFVIGEHLRIIRINSGR
jgi:hypothetical protein